MEKEFNGRIIQKHDIEANWEKAVNFSPMKGEVIIYDIDENYNYERLKIGDGETNVNDLPFVVDNTPVILEWLSLGASSNPNFDADNVAKLTSLRDSVLNNIELYLKTDNITYYKCVKYVKQSTMIEVTFEGEGKRYEISLYGAMTQCIYTSRDIHATTFNEFNNTDSATMKATADYIKSQIEANLLIDSEVTV